MVPVIADLRAKRLVKAAELLEENSYEILPRVPGQPLDQAKDEQPAGKDRA